MALHLQQQILNALKTRLLTSVTAAGSSVFLDRVDPLDSDELPAIVIEESPEGEAAEIYTISGVERRTYLVMVSCVVKDGEDAAAAARALGLQAEIAIATSQTLTRLAVLGVRLTASTMVSSGEGERRMAARQQRWQFEYLVNAQTPDSQEFKVPVGSDK